MLENHLWPSKNTSIFNKINNYSVSDISWQHFTNLRESAYLSGYRNAARTLVEHLEATSNFQNRAEYDTFIYPVIFLYRHTIELLLKSVLEKLYLLYEIDQSYYDDQNMGDSTNEPIELITSVLANEHSLKNLWNSFESHYSLLFKEETKEKGFAGSKKIIDQLHQIDKDSQKFRYALTKSKKLAVRIPNLDLSNFKFLMEGLCNFLEASIDQVADGIDQFPIENYNDKEDYNL